jgi:hypothetical protein
MLSVCILWEGLQDHSKPRQAAVFSHAGNFTACNRRMPACCMSHALLLHAHQSNQHDFHHDVVLSVAVWCGGCAEQVQLTTAVRCDLSRYQAFLKLVGFKNAPPRVRGAISTELFLVFLRWLQMQAHMHLSLFKF